MIKAVVFDLDNTVYSYDICHKAAMDALTEFACQKYKLNTVRFQQYFSEAKRSVKKQLDGTGASHNRMLYMQRFLELIGERPTSDAIELYDVYWDTFLVHIELFPYVKPLMTYLQTNKIYIGVLTDLTAHIQHRKIIKTGLDQFIDTIVTSEEAGEEKPSVKAFEMILRKLNIRPEESLMIGDSQTKDVEGAKSMGMRALLFTEKQSDTMKETVVEYIENESKI